MNLFTYHQALFEIAAFDLLIGFLLYRYYRSVPRAHPANLVPVSVAIIGGLINLSGLFCGAAIVEDLVFMGGAALIVLLSSDPGKRRPINTA